MTLSEAVEKILANSFAPHRAILISQINDLRGRRMNLLDDLRTTLEIIYYAALIAITLFQFRAVTLKVASLFIGIVKRGTGAFIAFFASMWMGILPVSFYTSARTIPMTNLYSWGMGIAMMGTFGALLEMIGVLMMGFGGIGYLFKKLSYPLAPLVLAIVIGDKAEDAFRQSVPAVVACPVDYGENLRLTEKLGAWVCP